MQESFEVIASGGGYRVVVGNALLEQLLAEHPDAIVLVDDFLVAALPVSVSRRIVIHASESSKSLEAMAEIILKLRELGANRWTHLIAIGGGVVQDIATFAASIYMRGIQWTYMPTTLLSMTDSCIGGKSSINVLGYKNLIGNFYPPEKVFVDVDFVKSLDEEMVVGGLFEAAKICYAHSFEAFGQYLSESPSARMQVDGVKRIIIHALRTKKWFIETDEFDQKERLLLNFGHTFGHAIEAGTDFGVSHGIAVGTGMLVAIEFSKRHGWLSSTGLERTSILAAHICAMLKNEGKNIATTPSEFDLSRILEKFDNDKKHSSEAYRIICPREDGGLRIVSEKKNAAVKEDMSHAFEAAFNRLGWSLNKKIAA
jgi:3-dehydroquinate synthase